MSNEAPWIQTPDYLRNRAKTLHNALLQLNTSMDKLVKLKVLTTGSERYKQWKTLLKQWGEWYGQTSLTGTWLWSSTDAVLEKYEQAYQVWRAWMSSKLDAEDIPLAAPSIKPPAGPLGDLPGWGPYLIGAGIVLGAAWVVGQVGRR